MEQHEHNHDHGHSNIPKFNSRDLIVREDIMAKAKELAELIYTSEEVQHYQKAEQKISNNERIQTLIASMKKKQKEIVAFEKFQNASMVAKIEKEIEQLQDELDGIPIVAEFQQSQSDINYLLQLIVSVISDTVSAKINVESGAVAASSDCSD
ncbi:MULTISPECIES: RicAFT regulatory complex protein RicA family protein [unclassified Paenibacillus]|uniref:RicAFT regulatory complex protein RicA family protein n=1 Tax=unclassified Paenibacillus TaxID=185978 RepID=UPI001C104704|nr:MULTISPECIES: YlbF family regulator [unclassified Paenibacillus]MBU5441848.1 YlbF family regulator [Paenibacillus sp. MSJ-34]CAH0119893.1 putative protein YmcA [Paenibacillus sp. CECT 9249]